MAGDCELLEHGINPNCDALNKVAGINRRIFIGELSQIDSAALTFGTDGEITGFGLNVGELFKLFISETFKQAGRDELVVNEFGVNTWKHFVDLVHYWFSQRDIHAIEQLARSKRLFCIIEQNNGQFVVYGLGNTALGYDNYGLKAESNTGTTGVALADDNTGKTTLSGEIPNKPILYKPAQDPVITKQELEGLSLIES